MPTYDFKCEFCKEPKERFMKVRDYEALKENPMICEEHQEIMHSVITKVGYRKIYTPNFHKQLGHMPHSLSEEKQLAKKYGMVDVSGEVKRFKKGQSKWKNTW